MSDEDNHNHRPQKPHRHKALPDDNGNLTSFRAKESSQEEPPVVRTYVSEGSSKPRRVYRPRSQVVGAPLPPPTEEAKEEDRLTDDEEYVTSRYTGSSAFYNDDRPPVEPGAEHVRGPAPNNLRRGDGGSIDPPQIPLPRGDVITQAELVEEGVPTGEDIHQLKENVTMLQRELQQQKEEDERERKKQFYMYLGILVLVLLVTVGVALVVVFVVDLGGGGSDETTNTATSEGDTTVSIDPSSSAPTSSIFDTISPSDPSRFPSGVPSTPPSIPMPTLMPSYFPSTSVSPSATTLSPTATKFDTFIPTEPPSALPSELSPTKSPSNSPSDLPTDLPTVVSLSHSPSGNPTSAREGEWAALIQSRAPFTSFDDPSSPQRFALDWMLSDPYTLSSSDDDRVVQRFALATFFFATDGPIAWDHGGWLTSSNECDWGIDPLDNGQDITCNAQGVVQRIALANDTLSGTIPNEIELLDASALTHFSLPMNELFGTIPNAIGTWTALTHLSLQNNFLEGTIPNSVTQLTDLTWIGLWENGLEGTIPANMNLLSNLEALYLQNNELSGTIPDLSSLTNLDQLLLYGNNLSGSILSSVCEISERVIIDCDQVACVPGCCLGSSPSTGTGPC